MMKTTIAAILVACALGGVSGCGDISADAGPPLGTATGGFDGVWEVSGGTRTAYPGQYENCGYGIGGGTLRIEGGRVAGDLTDNSGYAYVVDGTIDESGEIRGGFTYEGYDAATFEGVLSAEGGGGGWKDIYGCPGNWEAARQGGAVAHDADETTTAPASGASSSARSSTAG